MCCPAIAGTAGFSEFAEGALVDELPQDSAGNQWVSIEAGLCDLGQSEFGLIEKMGENCLVDAVLIWLDLLGDHSDFSGSPCCIRAAFRGLCRGCSLWGSGEMLNECRW